MRNIASGLILGAVLATAPCAAAGDGIRPVNLTCEHLVNPEGLDARQPRLAWKPQAQSPETRGQSQSAYQILVSDSRQNLAADQGNLWDSGKVISDTCSEIAYAGKPLASYQECFWKVRLWDGKGDLSDWSEPAFWSLGILDPAQWQGQWLSYTKPRKPDTSAVIKPSHKPWIQKAPSPMFRKAFEVHKPLARATASICGLGYYELRINGTKVGNRVLDPVFTRFDKRVLYATYDVTGRLTQGKNALGVMLGNGFYNPHWGDVWNFERAPWRGEPVLRFQLRLDYADGSHEFIVSDSTWRAATGPVIYDGVRNGEEYDARCEIPSWDTAAFDDSSWGPPQIVSGPKGVLRAQAMPPNRLMATLRPVKITEPKPGVFVFDLGQNFAGWAQLRVSGPVGTRVTMRYGERLGPNGLLERSTIDKFVHNGPFQTDAYILKGQGEEIWEPRFTYHGFRWVEIHGFPGKPTVDHLRGRVVHTAFTPAGSFTCSNKLFNQIQQLTLWAYRSNFVGFPTDCPQREKNGWTGDAHLAAEQALYNFHNLPAYEKWMSDFQDEMRPSGELPGIVPTSGWGYQWGNGPAWDSAYLLIPWYLYSYTGDTRVLAEHYGHMKRYVDYLTRRSKNQIVDIGLGDWVPAKTETPVAVTSTGYYFVDALILSRVAHLLGQENDARTYADLAESIRRSFQKQFIKASGVVANNSQTALSCALYQGLARPEEKAAILKQLVANVERQGGHLDTGILGAKYLLHALTDNGRVDVAYRIANQTTPPSYGDWIRRGATTLWEDWRDGESRNHIMFGDISAWFYQDLAGIQLDPEVPAFRRFLVRPRPVGDLQWVKANHDSVYGSIAVSWKREGETFSLEVAVPVSTRATVFVPARGPDVVKEGGRPAAHAPGVKFLRQENGTAIFEVGSGRYYFESR